MTAGQVLGERREASARRDLGRPPEPLEVAAFQGLLMRSLSAAHDNHLGPYRFTEE